MAPLHSFLIPLSISLLSFGVADASITVAYQQGQGPLGAAATTTAAAADYTGSAAYNPTVLNPPPPPSNPAMNTQFGIQLLSSGTTGMSIPQRGSFMGFSIEMSVVNQVLGKSSAFLQVPFLNLMANLQQRAGEVRIRIGGNTQETATLVANTTDGKILEKDINGVSNPTQTPPLIFTPDFLYMMSNVSSLVNVRWYLGIPFNDTSNFRLGIANTSAEILGDYLVGLQAGNEPDLYARHGHRPADYTPSSYVGEVGSLISAMTAGGPSFDRAKQLLVGPNLAMGDWTPEEVWDTGFIDLYSQNLAYLAMEKYPSDNCFAQFGVGTQRNPQDMFPTYLTHESGINIMKPYLNSTSFIQGKGKEMLMFETNTASCGGFPGISDSFGAALWALDYTLQMAHSNFSGALFHVGGQSVYYNPFTPPPTNQSSFHQWSIGPIYYSTLAMAEALGSSNKSQVLDLNANDGQQFTPAYAIYEDGAPVRVALFNYVTDASGANDITVSISIGGGQTGQPEGTPQQVKVKYLAASSVSQKGNITWAEQTFGENFESDGRIKGTENIVTVPCSQNTCAIKVPAPGFALVFLTDAAYSESSGGPSTTFATTALTKTRNTATIDPSVLATSNGHSGMEENLGSTSPGSVSSAPAGLSGAVKGAAMLAAFLSGAMVLGRALVR